MSGIFYHSLFVLTSHHDREGRPLDFVSLKSCINTMHYFSQTWRTAGQ